MEGFSLLFPYIFIQRSGEFNGEKVQNLDFLGIIIIFDMVIPSNL